MRNRFHTHAIRTTALLFSAILTAQAGDVRGTVTMPPNCSPEISSAVIWLEPEAGTAQKPSEPEPMPPGDLMLVRQAALQFVPRVVVLKKGQQIRFTNEDSEFHNVHVQARGELFNQTMPPGQPSVFTPKSTGILNVMCDIHHHMRAFVIIQDTPWIMACSPKGKYRFENVPAGKYKMTVWHEMGGKPIVRTIDVAEAGLDLDPIVLTDATVPPSRSALLASAPVLTWPEVVDRISVRLSSSLEAAKRADSAKRARVLAEDAYWVDFEATDMETAVRSHLGLDRAIEIEKKFLRFMSEIRDATKSDRRDISAPSVTMRGLLATLFRASEDLKSKGIVDKTKVLGSVRNDSGDAAPKSMSASSHAEIVKAIRSDFTKLIELAENGQGEEASSFVTSIYFGSFEPVEQQLVMRYPMQVAQIEGRFNELRGHLRDGRKGEELRRDVDSLVAEIDSLVGRSASSGSGTYLGGFLASLVTILREGMEVILLLTILAGIVSKVGAPGARKAFYVGVGAAVVASALTALAINTLVASTRAQTRELIEGVVMLAASAVLFYVSYWLIAQSHTKKWIEFLKNATKKGAAGGGFGTIGLTAFLAIYREGAETALMYQALLTNQTRESVYGVLSGLVVGLAILSVVAVAIRFASMKLPMQGFFKYTGMLLFGLAVIFAGKGVFELQVAGVLKTTTLGFPWPTVPDLGLYPNLQVFAIQSILLMGAVASILVLRLDNREAGPAESKQVTHGDDPSAVVLTEMRASSSEILPNVGQEAFRTVPMSRS